jgi:Na+-translocating ferredoxin:NAD+ oxidoreductase subunit D
MSTKLSLENAPHDLSISATGCIMRTVILTLVPAFFACMYFYGWGIFITLLICLTSCLTTEGIILKLRNHNINRLWRDSSAMVTAVLLSFTLPPLLPWYLSVIGCIFAIAIVKHTFGGLGQNIFNPAMGGFIFLLVSSPLAMTDYVNAVPGNWNNLTITRASSIIFNVDKENVIKQTQQDTIAYIADLHNLGELSVIADGFTGSTFLVDAKHEQPEHNVENYTTTHMNSILTYNFLAHLITGLCFIIGGIYLIFKQIIDYRIPLGFIGTVLIVSTISHSLDPQSFLPPFYHIVFGATIFGSFYILTDPVTAISKPAGAYIFSITIGIIFIVIRNFGGYPDAVAFSVLLGNAVAPLISILTKRREFGAGSKSGALYDRE